MTDITFDDFVSADNSVIVASELTDDDDIISKVTVQSSGEGAVSDDDEVEEVQEDAQKPRVTNVKAFNMVQLHTVKTEIGYTEQSRSSCAISL